MNIRKNVAYVDPDLTTSGRSGQGIRYALLLLTMVNSLAILQESIT